jgi:hypothetical protein
MSTTSDFKSNAYADKYVLFEGPSMLPCIMFTWNQSVSKAIDLALSKGLLVKDIDKPFTGTEIIGSKTSMIIRDYVKAPRSDMRLYDQCSVIEFDTQKQASQFIDRVLEKTAQHNHEIETITQTQDSKHFVIRSKQGYLLYCASVINKRFDAKNEQAVQLLLHWRIDYNAKSKRTADNTPAYSNLFDGTETNR